MLMWNLVAPKLSSQNLQILQYEGFLENWMINLDLMQAFS